LTILKILLDIHPGNLQIKGQSTYNNQGGRVTTPP
jgi:hypothetical protein